MDVREARELTVSAGTAADIDETVETVREIARWLATKGIGQWGESFPRRVVEAEVRDRELFIVRSNGEVVGSLVISRQDEIWGSADEDALFLLRLALRQGSRGRGLGRQVLAWVEEEGRRIGKKCVRGACHDQNEVLKSYYSSLGYVSRGVRHYDRYEMDFTLFEKDLRVG